MPIDNCGFVVMLGTCIACKQQFTFNPHKVPSLRVGGVRQPVCQSCIDAANVIRTEQNLPPHPVLPGAYDPMPEGEL